MFIKGDKIITLSNPIHGETNILFAKIIKDYNGTGKVFLKWEGNNPFESSWEYNLVEPLEVKYERNL